MNRTPCSFVYNFLFLALITLINPFACFAPNPDGTLTEQETKEIATAQEKSNLALTTAFSKHGLADDGLAELIQKTYKVEEELKSLRANSAGAKDAETFRKTLGTIAAYRKALTTQIVPATDSAEAKTEIEETRAALIAEAKTFLDAPGSDDDYEPGEAKKAFDALTKKNPALSTLEKQRGELSASASDFTTRSRELDAQIAEFKARQRVAYNVLDEPRFPEMFKLQKQKAALPAAGLSADDYETQSAALDAQIRKVRAQGDAEKEVFKGTEKQLVSAYKVQQASDRTRGDSGDDEDSDASSTYLIPRVNLLKKGASPAGAASGSGSGSTSFAPASATVDGGTVFIPNRAKSDDYSESRSDTESDDDVDPQKTSTRLQTRRVQTAKDLTDAEAEERSLEAGAKKEAARKRVAALQEEVQRIDGQIRAIEPLAAQTRAAEEASSASGDAGSGTDVGRGRALSEKDLAAANAALADAHAELQARDEFEKKMRNKLATQKVNDALSLVTLSPDAKTERKWRARAVRDQAGGPFKFLGDAALSAVAKQHLLAHAAGGAADDAYDAGDGAATEKLQKYKTAITTYLAANTAETTQIKAAARKISADVTAVQTAEPTATERAAWYSGASGREYGDILARKSAETKEAFARMDKRAPRGETSEQALNAKKDFAQSGDVQKALMTAAKKSLLAQLKSYEKSIRIISTSGVGSSTDATDLAQAFEGRDKLAAALRSDPLKYLSADAERFANFAQEFTKALPTSATLKPNSGEKPEDWAFRITEGRTPSTPAEKSAAKTYLRALMTEVQETLRTQPATPAASTTAPGAAPATAQPLSFEAELQSLRTDITFAAPDAKALKPEELQKQLEAAGISKKQAAALAKKATTAMTISADARFENVTANGKSALKDFALEGLTPQQRAQKRVVEDRQREKPGAVSSGELTTEQATIKRYIVVSKGGWKHSDGTDSAKGELLSKDGSSEPAIFDVRPSIVDDKEAVIELDLDVRNGALSKDALRRHIAEQLKKDIVGDPDLLRALTQPDSAISKIFMEHVGEHAEETYQTRSRPLKEQREQDLLGLAATNLVPVPNPQKLPSDARDRVATLAAAHLQALRAAKGDAAKEVVANKKYYSEYKKITPTAPATQLDVLEAAHNQMMQATKDERGQTLPGFNPVIIADGKTQMLASLAEDNIATAVRFKPEDLSLAGGAGKRTFEEVERHIGVTLAALNEARAAMPKDSDEFKANMELCKGLKIKLAEQANRQRELSEREAKLDALYETHDSGQKTFFRLRKSHTDAIAQLKKAAAAKAEALERSPLTGDEAKSLLRSLKDADGKSLLTIVSSDASRNGKPVESPEKLSFAAISANYTILQHQLDRAQAQYERALGTTRDKRPVEQLEARLKAYKQVYDFAYKNVLQAEAEHGQQMTAAKAEYARQTKERREKLLAKVIQKTDEDILTQAMQAAELRKQIKNLKASSADTTTQEIELEKVEARIKRLQTLKASGNIIEALGQEQEEAYQEALRKNGKQKNQGLRLRDVANAEVSALAFNPKASKTVAPSTKKTLAEQIKAERAVAGSPFSPVRTPETEAAVRAAFVARIETHGAGKQGSLASEQVRQELAAELAARGNRRQARDDEQAREGGTGLTKKVVVTPKPATPESKTTAAQRKFAADAQAAQRDIGTLDKAAQQARLEALALEHAKLNPQSKEAYETRKRLFTRRVELTDAAKAKLAAEMNNQGAQKVAATLARTAAPAATKPRAAIDTQQADTSAFMAKALELAKQQPATSGLKAKKNWGFFGKEVLTSDSQKAVEAVIRAYTDKGVFDAKSAQQALENRSTVDAATQKAIEKIAQQSGNEQDALATLTALSKGIKSTATPKELAAHVKALQKAKDKYKGTAAHLKAVRQVRKAHGLTKVTA